jgi:tetratricopeptide (TPR) repeat protein
MWHTYRRTRDDLAEALTLFAQARELDPDMAVAYAGAVDACFFQIVDGHAEDQEKSKQEAIGLGHRAVDLDGRDAMARYALGRAYTVSRRHAEAIPELEAALELNPSFAQAHNALGFALATSGRPEDAIPHIERAIRLSPHDPYSGQFLTHIAASHLFMHHHEEALKWAREALRQPNIRWSRWALLISALGHLGRVEEAAGALDELRRLNPEIDLDLIKGHWPISHAPSLAHLVAGLRAAGMAE